MAKIYSINSRVEALHSLAIVTSRMLFDQMAATVNNKDAQWDDDNDQVHQ